jgi:hypothetical protein
MAYTTVEKVTGMLPHRLIDNESRVKLRDVRAIISAVDKVVVGRLKIAGIAAATEVVLASYTDLLETIETLMSAGWVEQRFKADAEGDAGEEPNNNFYKEGSALLKRLEENNEFDSVTDIASRVNSWSGGTDGELDPAFKKNQRDW